MTTAKIAKIAILMIAIVMIVRSVDMCVKCKYRVFFNPTDLTLYYMDDNCNKVPLPAGTQIGGGTAGGGASHPNLPEIEPSQSVACSKANGAWDWVEDAMNAMINIWDNTTTAESAEKRAMQIYPYLWTDETPVYFTYAAWFNVTDYAAGKAYWTANKATIKEAVICALQYTLTNDPTWSAANSNTLGTYQPATGNAHLDDMLEGLLLNHDQPFVKKSAERFVANEAGTCTCTGSEPYTPPDGSEPPAAGCIKVYPPELAYSAYDGQNYAGTIAYSLANEVYGVQVSANHHKTIPAGNNGQGSDLFRLGLLYRISPGAQIIQVRWDWSSPYTQNPGTRVYQWSLGSYAVESSPHAVSQDEKVESGTSGTITAAVSGAYVTRYAILLSTFATVTQGFLNEIHIKNVQFKIKSIATGFEGWVRAGEELCD